MSTNASPESENTGSGSVHPSRSAFSPARLGSSRPSRPGQLDPSIVDNMVGGLDPQTVNEMSHTSAASLLDRVHHSEDPAVVDRVLSIVETEGVDAIAELWSDSEPESLPGILWRLYMLRTWMRHNGASIARLWRAGEPVTTSASAIAGVDQAPTDGDITRIADSILSGAFTGDFAVALERAAAFTAIIANGLGASTQNADDPAAVHALRRTQSNLANTSTTFLHGANLWRRGRLE